MNMDPQNQSGWSATGRLAFKFILAYFLLHALPLHMLYQDLVIWFGQNVLEIEQSISTRNTGSGDTLYQWLLLWVNLLLALLISFVWTGIDRNRKSYHRSAEILYILARYYLAFVLFGYGIAKVIPTQFSLPNFIRLTQEYGTSSPMGLAWTFLGFSTGYQIFSGMMEVIGGVLLLFRRTTLIGALVSMAVMTNVFMINMFFDVPVKIFSGHLLFISAGLASLHLRPLWNFFIMQKSARQNIRPFPVEDKGWRKISYTFKGILITGIIGMQVYGVFSRYSNQPEPLKIAGIYMVQEFSINNEEVPRLTSNPDRWNRVVIDDRLAGLMAIDYTSADRVRLRAAISVDADSLSGNIPGNPASRGQRGKQLDIAFHQSGERELIFNGTLGNDSLFVRLEKLSSDELLLTSRGFNWVNEFPFNR